MGSRRKILAYSLLVVGVLGTLFFNNNVNIIPFTILFRILAVIIGLVGLIMLFTTLSYKKMKEQQQLKQLIEELKANGEQITVDLSQCHILEHSYTEALESRPLFDEIAIGDLEMLIPGDETMQRDKTNMTKIENVTQSILVYETEVRGIHRRFVSQVINKDKATLMFLLDAQKQTVLYYDKKDPSRCYFVLDFLES